ncbi:hypothetical protein OPV22_020832 [Ensete ventricosum]|uniref:Histone deacetylase domain-containing protein n=1 Tax=Ensete ventricosum TaxID=4639 RepID=A0AAV8QHC4_ENSVE|nr:hypothetical protein OPV22_020832 [Ensete ventricosum]
MDPQPPSPPLTAARPRAVIHVFWHEGMLDHDTGVGVFDTGFDPGFLEVLDKHPENADRVRNMVSILRKGPLAPFVSWHPGRPAHLSELFSFHTPEYVEELVQANVAGHKELCPGTFMNPGSWGAALLAVGTTLSAMKHILDGNGKLAYALVRPPGHHAQPCRADGYCFLNNAGLAVQLALDSGCRKDGSIDEVGEGSGFGYNLNIPLPNGTGDEGYAYAMNQLVVPAIQKFEPGLIVLVVGQDSSAFDPNGRQCLTMAGYKKIGEVVRKLADMYSEGRILVVQEGGYHVTYSAYCLHATLEGILNLPAPLLSDPIAYYPEDKAFTVKVVDSIKSYWKECIPFLG